ncbi:MAG: aminotransferase class I/II-fold pyridoxal phosphate-dependent enzyme, partial [Candidatus Eisenbacteria sp.]|nr:aminotransferase class I/II-fold pyridoxal phosphate-dependent enzyme [Candidatus Eisenbacteria bacterium]
MVPEPAQQATRTVADRVSRVPASPTLKIAAKARAMVAEGIDVIDLSVGEPDFATPDHIKQAAKRAIDENFTKYTANTGVPELRQAIADRLRDDHGIDYAIEEIIVSPGAKSCLYNLCGAIL